MISQDDFLFLSSKEGRELILKYRGSNGNELALKGVPRAVCSAVANLERCKIKLPEHYAVSAIIDDLAYQQSSSSATARAKEYSGGSCLDLTCGLGVDSYFLSQKFDRVVSIEQNELYAQIARYNISLLGASNVEVVNCMAEEYLAKVIDKFDMVYVDPARRDESQRTFLFEDCSPNILALIDKIFTITNQLVIKASPLFDCDMAYRLFSNYGKVTITAVSYARECKELLIDIVKGADKQSICGVKHISNDGAISSYYSNYTQIVDIKVIDDINRAKYLYIADVAFYKMRRLDMAAGDSCYASSREGVLLSQEQVSVEGSSFKIINIFEYQPQKIKKYLKSRGKNRATIYRRGSRVLGSQIRKTLNIVDSSSTHLVFTSYKGKDIMVEVEPLP